MSWRPKPERKRAYAGYDATFKLLLKDSPRLMRELVGAPVVNWLDVELPKVQNPRVDLLGETALGKLLHLELQSRNDPVMALRMLEYKIGIYRKLKRFPRQILLYVGEAPMHMPLELGDEDLRFQYHAVDIRSLDGEELLSSDGLGDD
jgi:predicted transposase YdaD